MTDKDKLLMNAKKKITTTMIGAIAILENSIDFKDGVYNQEAFSKIRREILELGNLQIKNLEKEFKQYNITWNKFSYKLRFKDVRND